MEARRRTLAADPAAGNQLPMSHIPVPSSAIKRGPMRSSHSQAGMRQSLAPGAAAARASVAGLTTSQQSSSQHSQDGGYSQGSLSGPARRSTMSMNRASVAGDAGMSGGRGDGGMYGRTPSGARGVPPGSIRRSSSFSSQGRQSVAGAPMLGSLSASVAKPSSSSSISDPREIRTAAFMQQCRDNIHDYLQTHRCPLPFGPKYLTSPTTKEFQSLFKFLVTDALDPGYLWGKSFESDVMQILRDMRYPTPEQVGKTALSAAGAPNNWPQILAMLNWLVELSRAIDTWHDAELIADPCLMTDDQLPDETEGVELFLFANFCKASFTKWFDGDEEFPAEEQALSDRFERMTQGNYEEFERLQEEYNKVNKSLSILSSQDSPLKRLEEEHQNLQGDRIKFINYINVNNDKQEKTKQKLAVAQQALSGHIAELDKSMSEYRHLQKLYNEQGISPEEVHRMNAERHALIDAIRDSRASIKALQTNIYELELSSTKKVDVLEKDHKDYIELAYKIHLIGQNARGPEGVDFNFDLDMGAADLTAVQIAGAMMKERIRPALQSYGDGIRADFQQRTDESISFEDEHDRLASVVDAKTEAVKTLEIKFKIAHDQAEASKQKFQAETQDLQDRVAKLEADVSAMSMSSQQDLLAVESELERLKVARAELEHNTSQLRERIIAEMSMHLDLMLKTKEHASGRLQELRNFAKTKK